MGIKNSKFDVSDAQKQQQSKFPGKDNGQNVSEKPMNSLRKRLLKGNYDLNDPRSPTTQLNRTPLVFDDPMERTLNLNDTFSDLFTATKSKTNTQISTNSGDVSNEINVKKICTTVETKSANFEIESLYHDEETLMSSAILKQTDNIEEEKLNDPRSPTIGVLRTPIILSESEMCNDENINNSFSTLSINNDNANNASVFEEGKQSIINKLENKHLNKVKSNTKRKQRKRIFVDTENQYNSTPNAKSATKEFNVDKNKRTPFSCVKNRAHLRSRSVENSSKAIKTRLTLTSFDDNLNPNDNIALQCYQTAFE